MFVCWTGSDNGLVVDARPVTNLSLGRAHPKMTIHPDQFDRSMPMNQQNTSPSICFLFPHSWCCYCVKICYCLFVFVVCLPCLLPWIFNFSIVCVLSTRVNYINKKMVIWSMSSCCCSLRIFVDDCGVLLDVFTMMLMIKVTRTAAATCSRWRFLHESTIALCDNKW